MSKSDLKYICRDFASNERPFERHIQVCVEATFLSFWGIVIIVWATCIKQFSKWNWQRLYGEQNLFS
jgi:hypothetical protein